MSIQILGLRTFEKNGEKITADCYHKKNWRAPDIPTLFRELPSYLEQIPEKERWNLFYTVATCSDGKREFASQAVIAFDIDGVPEEERQRAGLAAVGALGLDPAKTALVSSGGGLHVVVLLASPITSRGFFKEHKAAYGGACDRIAVALKKAGLTHKIVDPVVFEPRRILRLPGTENRKEGKPARKCHLLQANLLPQEFNLADFFPTGAPVKAKDHIPARALARYGATDTPAVLQGCDFLRWAHESPGSVNEPQWYAALSIVARLTPHDGKDAPTLCHEMSSGHSGYDQDTTDKKIAQALDASGPRTCHGINALWGGRCVECPHFEKVVSPIQIVSPDKIQTELTGFHRIQASGKATPIPGDLRRYFRREHSYVTMEGARTVYAFDGKCYQPWGNNKLEQFAFLNYRPEPVPSLMRQFRELVGSTEIVSPGWFDESTGSLINFENGVLNVETGEFMPHSPTWGFRYVLPYPYDPSARAPLFMKTLALVTGGDPQVAAIIGEMFGYAVSGCDYWHHKALILDGGGSNGKSTIVQVLQDLAGRDNFSTVALKDLEDPYHRALFDGKLFNISDETPTKALMDASYFKAMSSGSAITVRSPYKEPYTLRNRAKFLITCNQLPHTFDTSFGLIRRLTIIPFTQTLTRDTVCDFDPHINRKLRAELSGIFNFALAGYQRLKSQGAFTECAAVDRKVEEFALSVDTVKDWFLSEVVRLENGHAEAFVPMEVLFEHYRDRTKRYEMRPVTFIQFGKDLKKHVPNYEKHVARELYPKVGKYRQKKVGLRGWGLLRDYGELDDHPAPAPMELA